LGRKENTKRLIMKHVAQENGFEKRVGEGLSRKMHGERHVTTSSESDVCLLPWKNDRCLLGLVKLRPKWSGDLGGARENSRLNFVGNLRGSLSLQKSGGESAVARSNMPGGG